MEPLRKLQKVRKDILQSFFARNFPYDYKGVEIKNEYANK